MPIPCTSNFENNDCCFRFNSYTQEICVDDAVVVDPDRIDNSVTNDGFTMRDLRFAISSAHTQSPASEGSGDTPLSSSSGEEAKMTPENDSNALASRSFAFQFEQRAQQIKNLIDETTSLEAEVDTITDVAQRRQKIQTLANKRIRLSKLKTLEVTEALKSADSKSLAEELANRGRSQVGLENHPMMRL
jgi:hypothetical protein